MQEYIERECQIAVLYPGVLSERGQFSRSMFNKYYGIQYLAGVIACLDEESFGPSFRIRPGEARNYYQAAHPSNTQAAAGECWEQRCASSSQALY